MTYDCGCWTDEDGYWQLSPECLAHERLVWAQVMQKIADGNHRLDMTSHLRKAPKFVYIGHKLRLIEDYELPEDTTE
jgi:hypothetical protein